MNERRRWPRYPALWWAQLCLEEGGAILSSAVDVSLHGLRLRVFPADASMLLRPGELYRVEIHVPELEVGFVRVGEIRHIGDQGVRFQIIEPLPRSVLVDRAEAARASGLAEASVEIAVPQPTAEAPRIIRPKALDLARTVLFRRRHRVP